MFTVTEHNGYQDTVFNLLNFEDSLKYATMFFQTTKLWHMARIARFFTYKRHHNI
jgi:hypothetical protein